MAVLVGIIGNLPVSLVSALAVQVRASLHFGASALGLGVALFFLAAAASSVPLSRVSERVGAIRVMRVNAVATAVLMAASAVAGSWPLLVALLVLSGVSAAAMQPAVNLFLARRIPSGRQGLAFGVKQAAIPLAVLLAGVAVPGIALTVGWRWAFGAAAAIAAGTALLIPQPPTSLADRRRQAPAAGPPVPVVPLAVISLGFGFGVFATTGLWSFLVTSGVAAGLGEGAAGLVAALAGGAAMAMRIAMGAAADRRGRRHFQVVASLLAVGAVGYAVLAIGSGAHAVWIFTAGAVLALGTAWGCNGLFAFAVVDSHRHAPARATGLTAVGVRLGGVAGPLTVGLIVTRFSFSTAWCVAGVAALLAGGTVAYGSRLLARHNSPAP